MAAEWRLLDDGVGDADWNMAVDRAIQVEHAAGRSPATLRLYRWSRPTVSLGKFQRVDGVDLDLCAREGIDVVRRFTGGRGVLHDDELTYAIVAGERDGVPRGVSASYRYLCTALADAYRRLGVAAELTARPRGERDSSACYLHATHADLSLGAAKLSGSAQVWFEHTCLQHGSFVRSRDVEREAAVFVLDDGARDALAEATVTLSDVQGAVTDMERIGSAVAEAVGETLGVALVPGELTSEERVLARGFLDSVQVIDGDRDDVSG